MEINLNDYELMKGLHCCGCYFYPEGGGFCKVMNTGKCKANVDEGYRKVEHDGDKLQVLRTINLGDHLGLVDVIKGGDCKDCMFEAGYSSCGSKAIEVISGFDCDVDDCYFIKHVEQPIVRWVQCTPDNIKVGDEVISKINPDNKYTVYSVFDKGRQMTLPLEVDGEYRKISRPTSMFLKKVVVDSGNLPQPIVERKIASFAEMEAGDKGVVISSKYHKHYIGRQVIKLLNGYVVDVNVGAYWSNGDSIDTIVVEIVN